VQVLQSIIVAAPWIINAEETIGYYCTPCFITGQQR
jgi:hypothetical protein